jgi:hypothetical protein
MDDAIPEPGPAARLPLSGLSLSEPQAASAVAATAAKNARQAIAAGYHKASGAAMAAA